MDRRRRVKLMMGQGQGDINKICPVITPTLGTELLTDPDLEGTYTSGLCAALTKAGNPTLSESADAHKGSKAQQFTGGADIDRIFFPNYTPTVGMVYQGTAWAKRTAGSTGGVGHGLYNAQSRTVMNRITSAEYTEDLATIIITQVNPVSVFAAIQYGTAGYDTVIVDDFSLKPVTNTDHYLGKLNHKNGTYICHPTMRLDTQCGMKICYLDSTNFVLAMLIRPTGLNPAQARLWKSINNVWTLVISGNITYGAEKELKVVVANNTDFSLYYDSAQVGTTQAITDSLGRAVYGFNTYASNLVGRVQTINP